MTDAPLKPLGHDHFELRAELGTALFALLTTAQEMGLDSPGMAELHRSITDFRAPFMFVVAGEVKAGKSAFLNALFGAEVCRSDPLPTTDRVHKFKYALEAKDAPSGLALIDHYRPVNFLRDFHLVDTPGTNSIETGHTHLAEGFIPLCDLVFFIFPVTNPWGASAWELLERIQKKWLRHVVLIVQQCDLRDPAEIELITTHLRQVCRQRLGSVLPLFAVSAKKALLAKTTGLDKERLWRESGFAPVEDCINAFLESDPMRIQRLSRGALSARLELGGLREYSLKALHLVADDRTEILASVQQLQEKQHDQLQAVDHIHFDFDRALSRCWLRGEQMLEERLRPWRAVRIALGRDRTWRNSFRAALEPVLRSTLSRQVASALTAMEAEMRTSRTQLAHTLRTWLGAMRRERGDARAKGWREQREKHLEQALAETTAALQSDVLTREIRELFDAAAGEYLMGHAEPGESVAATFTRRLTELGLESCVAALEEIPGGMGIGAVSRRAKIIDAYHVGMSDRGAALARTVRTVFERLVEHYYDRLLRTFAPLEEFRATEEVRWKSIDNRLAALETRLQDVSRKLT